MPMRTSHLSTKRQRLPRYYKFESISLHRRVDREPEFLGGHRNSLLPARGFRALAGIAMAGMYMPGLTHGVEGATRARIAA